MDEKRNISVCFTADQFYKFSDGKSTVVVVDILRATSVISTEAFYARCERNYSSSIFRRGIIL